MGANAAGIPDRSRQAIPDLLDLTDFYTHGLDQHWLGTTGMNLGSLGKGVRAFARSAFDVRGLIQLGGGTTDGPRTTSVNVGLQGRRFHFLHGARGTAPTDAQVARYVVRYVDGQTREIPILYGRHLRDAFETDRSPLADAEVIIPDPTVSEPGMQLARYVANNPLPHVEVQAIDITSTMTEAAPFVVAITFERNDPVYEWFDSISIGQYNPIAPRGAEATPDQVDLSAFYGASLDDDWFHHSSHDLHDVPRGIQSFADTTFDVRGLIVLGGSRSLEITGLALPEAVRGIPVHRTGRQIHFLHACGFAAPRETKIGEYVIHYVDGEEGSAPIVYGRNIMDWWESDVLSDARVAWIGSNAATRLVGKQTHLIKYTWDNPRPGVEIASIDIVSALEDPAPFLVAVTIEPA